MRSFNKKCVLYLVAGAAFIMLSSCTSLPKMATLQPIPEYPEDTGGWQTTATCVLVAEEPQTPVDEILKRFSAAGYTVSLAPPGYLTRQQRLSVNKAIVVESFYAVPMTFSDGNCIDGKIKISVHDTANLGKGGTFEARTRFISQPIDLKSKPGGKELLKELKTDPKKVVKVPDILGKDPQTTTSAYLNGKVYIAEGNIFDNLMNNLLCQPEVRLALAPAS